jgi:type III secretion protein C
VAFTDGDPADHILWKTSEYYHFAKNQELKEMVRNFCASQSMDVIISEAVNDIVNGKFNDVSPRQFWKDIVKAYGLVWFYDGSMMYVYKSSEVTSAVYQMSRDEMRTLVKVITQLRWLSSNVNFRPMEMAGILVVSGPPKLMSLLEELSKKVVVERVSDVYDIRSFPLKHAWAYDMTVNYRGGNMNIPGVATMLQQIVSTLSGPIGESNIGVTINNSQSNEATDLKAIPGTVYHTNGPKKSGKEDNKSDNKSDNKNAKNGETNPLNMGAIFVTYDTRLNAVIVKAKRQDMSFVEKIIEQLDVARDAIKIDIAVVDISKAGAKQIGNKFAASKRDTAEVKANVSSGAATNMERIKFDSSIEGGASVTMNFDKLFRSYSLSQTLNILEKVGNAQTLTRSSVITLDNIGAVIDRSNTVYMPVSGAKAGGLFNVTVSTKLIVVPHIIPGVFDGNGSPKIKLLIEVTDGSFDKDPRGGTTGPSTATNSVNTEASLFEGQSLFIGGYFYERHSLDSTGIPFLKDIPILGYLFKSDNREDSIMERIYIITPSLVNVDDPKKTQLNRFFTDGQLAGEPTLKPDEFTLTHDYERPSFDDATFEVNDPKHSWGKLFQKGEKDADDPKDRKTTNRRRRMKACHR